MASYTLMVMCSPPPQAEEDFNRWYDVHLANVLTTPGFNSARRLKAHPAHQASHGYVALYEIETDDPEAAMAQVNARAASGEWDSSRALAPLLGPTVVTLFENVGPVVRTA